MPTRTLFATVTVLLFLSWTGSSASPAPRILSDADWRADIATVADAIREIHPRPFRTIAEVDFETDYRRLLHDVPNLSDKEIVVRLAALVALVTDGHTRIAFPREHPEIGLEFGHTSTPLPGNESLRFSQLPLAFEQFADGIYVVAANRDHAALIGQRLEAIGGTSAKDAMRAVQAVTFAENSQLGALMGADRLSMPDVLYALGITESADAVQLELTGAGGDTSRLSLGPLPPGTLDWIGPFDRAEQPLRLRHRDKDFWSRFVPDGGFVYMQINEITDGDEPLAKFVVGTLNEALERDAKLVIDLRNNFGGSGHLNRTLVTSIIGSDSLNRWDRTFVLTGRRTFSAAQMLVNELERYTRVTFVGEPTGSRPDHFGDPKKIRLEHSGLILRVSRLHWSSYSAFDDREATNPDFLVRGYSAAFFAGGDPALSIASSPIDVSLKSLLRAAFERGDLQQVARYTLDSKLSPETYEYDFSSILLDLGKEFMSAGQHEKASLAFRVGLYYFPEHDALTGALESLPSP